MSKHTPGPWHARGGEISAGNRLIGWASCGTRPPDTTLSYIDNVGQANANAHLMAAAPDLLAELTHLVRLLEPLERDGTLAVPGLATLNAARAAMAKAEGR